MNIDPILTNTPDTAARGVWNKGALQVDGALSLPISENTYTNTDLRKEGQLMYSSSDKVPKFNTGNYWVSLKEYITPEMFGAKGDGITDDTIAIQNMFDSLLSQDAWIVFSHGTYIVSDIITIQYPCIIQGFGANRANDIAGATEYVSGNSTIVQTEGDKGLFYITAKTVDFKDIALLNLSETPATEGTGIYYEQGSFSRISNVAVTRFYDNIWFENAYYFTITDSNFFFPSRYNIHIANEVFPDGGDSAISNCYFVGGWVAGMTDIHWTSAGGLRITNCKFQTAGPNLAKKGCIDAAFTDNTILFLAANNSFESFQEFGIRVKPEPGIKFNNVKITGNTLDPVNPSWEADCILLDGDSVQKINIVNVTDNILQVRNANGSGVTAINVNLGEFQNTINTTLGATTNFYSFTGCTSLASRFPNAMYVNKDYMPALNATSANPILAVDNTTGLMSQYPANTFIKNQTATPQSASFNISGTGQIAKLGIGTAPISTSNVVAVTPITGGIVAYNEYMSPTVQLDVTSQAYGRVSEIGVVASAVVSSIYHNAVRQGTFGSGASVTNQTGFRVESNFIGATGLNLGFASFIPAGTNRYNLYMGGTADNYFGGKVGVSILTPTARMDIAEGTAAAGTAPIKLHSGVLLTSAEVGAEEFLSDKRYFTITTGAARKEYTFNDAALNSGIVPVTTTNGRLTNSTVTTTELGYLSGATSAIQTQINAKAPLASPSFTGNPTVPNQPTGDNDTSAANTAFVQQELAASNRSILNDSLTTVQTTANLDALYPSVPLPYYVIAKNTTGSPMIYIKHSPGVWMFQPLGFTS